MFSRIHLKKYTIYLLLITAVILTLLLTIVIKKYILPKHLNSLSNLNIYIKPINENINVVCADSSNKLTLKIEVKNQLGQPVANIPIVLSVDNDAGILSSRKAKTNNFGEVIIEYIPPDNINDVKNDFKVIIRAKIINKLSNFSNTSLKNSNECSYVIRLIPVPVILVHGYQSTSDVFTNMIKYLNSLGFTTITFDYNSLQGIVKAANELRNFLLDQTKAFSLKGIQIKRFDIIAHSMGGLVSRYYSVSKDYIEFNNIRKLIFISCPHNGSHLAPIGAKYFNDESVKDMMPESNLFTKIFPQMINKGLNPYISTGNIIGQFDEVVSIEGASLDYWGIESKIFNLGGIKLSVDNFLDGTISQTAIHKIILNNIKVYENIVDMLIKSTSYPLKIE